MLHVACAALRNGAHQWALWAFSGCVPAAVGVHLCVRARVGVCACTQRPQEQLLQLRIWSWGPLTCRNIQKIRTQLWGEGERDRFKSVVLFMGTWVKNGLVGTMTEVLYYSYGCPSSGCSAAAMTQVHFAFYCKRKKINEEWGVWTDYWLGSWEEFKDTIDPEMAQWYGLINWQHYYRELCCPFYFCIATCLCFYVYPTLVYFFLLITAQFVPPNLLSNSWWQKETALILKGRFRKQVGPMVAV